MTGDELFEFYGGEVPEYVKGAGKTFIVLVFGNEWNGDIKPRKITISDVVEYYRSQANNIVSGCRSLAGFVSDWRYVDAIAKECLEWFKFVNVEELRRESRKAGLVPKF